MSKTKIYAVKIGRKVGLFNSWEECKEQVIGYNGAIYKSFNNEQDALNFLNDLKSSNIVNIDNSNLKDIVNKEVNSNITVVFVDGSYENSVKIYSYGIFIITKKNNLINEYELYDSFNNPLYLKSRNVSGEIFGVIKSLEWCILNNKKDVKIYYDYAGIENWANNNWKTNTEIAKLYKDFLNNNLSFFNSVQFQKVEAHTGIEYNERADKLAKYAISVSKLK